MIDKIIVRGAKENNLKNVSLEVPRDKLVVFTGVSGSGKSTLAFDTIFAEGQRRYVESLSSYARQFLGQSQKPDVESIDGLSPAISIDQKSTNHNPRSTVGTITEIYDYLRLLFSRIGTPICPTCGIKIEKQTVDQIVDKIMKLGVDEKILLLSPVIKGQKGTHQKLLEDLKKSGFARVKIDGTMTTLDDVVELDKNKKHTIEVVVDRLVLSGDILSRLSESVETCLGLSKGTLLVEHLFSIPTQEGEVKKESKRYIYSVNFSCPDCEWTIDEITPRMFSFNSPYGACSDCSGLGFTMDIDEKLIMKNADKSINEGAFNITGWNAERGSIASTYFFNLSRMYGINLDVPVKDLPREHLNIILYGNQGEKMQMNMSGSKFSGTYNASFEGLIPNLSRRYRETTSEFIKWEISKLMCQQSCRTCSGKRLSQSALSVRIDDKNIDDFCQMSIENLYHYVISLFENNSENSFTMEQLEISAPIVKEIKARLKFLIDVGLSYLTLSRMAETLSGGEAQRIRLATQIGSGLMGVLYILDEPSIGLHQRDNDRLLATLKHLRDLGNTLIVVEHDEETMRSADYIVDVGPGAGIHGGEIVAAGNISDICQCHNSYTGKYLSGKLKIEVPATRRKSDRFIEVVNACQNNLKQIHVKIPLGVFNVITGVSGSGKSSLINGVLYPYLANTLNRASQPLGKGEVVGVEQLDKVIAIDQSPIGRTPRSNPATYTGVFTEIRELFALTQEAKVRGYSAGRFSFNVKGGRCEACDGNGVKEIEMYFLPDITVPCEVCGGKRYNRETLEVRYKGKTISDVLDMTIEEAAVFFSGLPNIYKKVNALFEVGLGYMRLGQSATTLSGGEAQRVKLAAELCRPSTGKTIYILDEPTTGLHMFDIHRLIDILGRLVQAGNTVLVIEHNLDVIKCADHVIDLGSEGGDKGGEVVVTGTPEEVSTCEESHTGRYLRKALLR